MTAEFPIYFDWWLRVDFNNFKWYDHREKEPYYYMKEIINYRLLAHSFVLHLIVVQGTIAIASS